MKVSAIQLRVDDSSSPDERCHDALGQVRREAAAGADLVVLPEMWLPGYFGFDDYAGLSEEFSSGPTVAALAGVARDAGVYLCAGSLVERSGGSLFNTTTVFDRSGDIVATYRKIHLFGYGSKEQALLTPGGEIVTVDLDGMRVGLSTCYDLRFPELYRRQIDEGAEMLIIVAAWPFPRLPAWQCLLRARAIENQSFVLGCNAAGTQSGSTFVGATAAFDPMGNSLGDLDHRPGCLRFAVATSTVGDVRKEFPALADRRLR